MKRKIHEVKRSKSKNITISNPTAEDLKFRPNYDMLIDSIICSLRTTYNEYKKACSDWYKFTWINDEGDFVILAGWEERAAKIEELSEEIDRLQYKLDEIKQAKEVGAYVGF